MSSWWSWSTSRAVRARQALRGIDPVLLARVFAVSASVPLLMRLNLSQLQRVLGLRRARPSTPTIDAIVRHAGIVRRWGSPIVQRGCLTRGVTLCYFCRWAGVDVRLAFGMARSADGFTGHCWLVKDDQPFLEPVDPRLKFTEIVSIPAAVFDAPRPSPRMLSRLTSR